MELSFPKHRTKGGLEKMGALEKPQNASMREGVGINGKDWKMTKIL